MLSQLIHNGVVVPEPPPPTGMVLAINGEPVNLTPKQEEMALAWAKKQGTPYVEDRTFIRNFLDDFGQELGLNSSLSLEDVDFGPAIRIVERERETRERMTKEERKELAAERKALREAMREEYGFALVNGDRTELANYVVEPSGIFMGRGKHPLRGRWKEGAKHSDITLNLSPDAPVPPGQWAEIVWQPESLWVARWKDKLSGKLKYVWLSDTAPIKQAREAAKFDTVHELHAHLGSVRAQIERDLFHSDAKVRMIATACYLIDALCLRVGDEKDPDEADTVGATTLRPEHVTLHSDGSAEFRFLGKDSVLWHKTLDLPEQVQVNLSELLSNARPSSSSANSDKSHPTRDRPQLFPDISSRDVNAYLSGILPVLTAKVFRTHHATIAVRECLIGSGIEPSDPTYLKWETANLANLEAAILCNHTKMAPASWSRSRERYKERQEKAADRVRNYQERLKAQREALTALRQEAREKRQAAPKAKKKQVKARYQKRLGVAERRVERTREMLEKAKLSRDKIKAQYSIASKKRTWNLGTSLKSYIDPRVYYQWGRQVDYDVLGKYYPKALRRKFAWVKSEPQHESSVQAEDRGPQEVIPPSRGFAPQAQDTGQPAQEDIHAAQREILPELGDSSQSTDFGPEAQEVVRAVPEEAHEPADLA
jgi:DNA topoisomerase-1